MPAALALSRIAERTLGKVLGSADKARRLALPLSFRAAPGIERILHFETLDDLGFAILSGGKRGLSRSRPGGLVRAVKTIAVKKLARAAEQLGALRDKVVTLRLDEHAIARFTRKFRIPKGVHALRNKKMRIEKLVYMYWPARRRFLQLVVSPRHRGLRCLVRRATSAGFARSARSMSIETAPRPRARQRARADGSITLVR
ncbi:hypothetical protein WMF37_51010 [Sorangium sp. So ce291]|uniref:hypothetical protein n=1 Tax=Sorangium sp. So ce291 TaxID=3133294 RepID=UPI003F60F57E